MYRNDDLLDPAYGSAIMGNPIKAIAWLANEIGVYDISLDSGEIILAGALSKPVPLEVGDQFKVEFESLGTVASCTGARIRNDGR